jgi:hypothetical protein
VSAESFARSLIDALVPDEEGTTTLVRLKEALKTDESIGSDLKSHLASLIAEASHDIATFRRSLERWYDDHMSRVSGWYKRHVRWISLGLAAALVVLFNVNAVQIAQSLYSDEALRASVVTEATQAADCGDKEPAACLSQVREEIEGLRGTGLPIGWGTSAVCAVPAKDCRIWADAGLTDPDRGFGWDVWLFLQVLIGWLLMAAATLPGARFWFDALSRLGSLRSSGPKPGTG